MGCAATCFLAGNPTNIIVAVAYQMSFVDYSRWMALPTLGAGTAANLASCPADNTIQQTHDIACIMQLHVQQQHDPQPSSNQSTAEHLAVVVLAHTCPGSFRQ
jgi:Na+/H+ antiporter NhaD/arsenite permease-like protein